MLTAILLGAALLQTPSVPQALADGRRLVLDDEFDVTGKLDKTKWGYETGNLRNDEQQYFVGDRSNNSWVEDGHFVIQARRECWDRWDYTSASVFALKPLVHARVEVRAKVPAGRGVASLIWLMGADFPTTMWPECGEISMLEHVGRDPNAASVTINSKEFNVQKDNELTGSLEAPDFAASYHLYVMDWTAENITLSIDGKEILTYAKDPKKLDGWPFDKPMMLKMQLGVGGALGGSTGEGKDTHKGIDTEMFPKQMLIDYVRVYE